MICTLYSFLPGEENSGGLETSGTSDGLFPHMFVNLNSTPGTPHATSLFHGSSIAAAAAGSSRGFATDAVSSLNHSINQPYGAEMSHYGPLYYSNYATSSNQVELLPMAEVLTNTTMSIKISVVLLLFPIHMTLDEPFLSNPLLKLTNIIIGRN